MRAIFIFLFLLLPVGLFSQSPFKGFFKPVDRTSLKVDITTDQGIKADQNARIWLVRPKISLTATQINLKKPYEVTPFNSVGMGMTYANIINQDDKPYTRFGISALLLFTDGLKDTEPFKLSGAVTVTALNIMDVGAGYSFYAKSPFLLIGITYNFN